MSSAKRTIEIPKRPTPLALPLGMGYRDGSSAHIITDANGAAIATSFALPPSMTVSEAKSSALTALHVKEIEYLINAVNSYEALAVALLMIHAIAPNKTTAELAKKALIAAGELKE